MSIMRVLQCFVFLITNGDYNTRIELTILRQLCILPTGFRCVTKIVFKNGPQPNKKRLSSFRVGRIAMEVVLMVLNYYVYHPRLTSLESNIDHTKTAARKVLRLIIIAFQPARNKYRYLRVEGQERPRTVYKNITA